MYKYYILRSFLNISVLFLCSCVSLLLDNDIFWCKRGKFFVIKKILYVYVCILECIYVCSMHAGA